jgi:transmembrane sensor
VTEANNEQDRIDTIAADWAARAAAGPLTDADRRGFDSWLGEDPRHGIAFAEARRAWAVMGEVAREPGPLHQDIVPAKSPRRRAWRPMAAVAASLMILLAGSILWFGDPSLLLTADHRTAPGERSTVTLADGSTVTLGPATALAIKYSDTERRLELLAGVAYFRAAPLRGDERRPFIVQAANGTVRALGTEFAIDRLANSVEVVVAEHDVAVTLADGIRREIVLAPGQALRYADAGLGPVRQVNVGMATAWQRGRLIFDQMPLGDVVTELNRYRRGRIMITDDALSAKSVSGVFDTANPDNVLTTITRELGVRTASLPPMITLLY